MTAISHVTELGARAGDGGTGGTRDWNPLARDPVATHWSSYAAYREDAVVRPLAAQARVDADLIAAHGRLREHVLGEGFPCVGARSALNRLDYRFGLYPRLAGEGAVRAVCHDLYEFCHEFPDVGDRFLTFVAMFREPAIENELHFEDSLWRQLQAMHDLDSQHFGWDRTLDADPAHNNFSFSMGGRGMFVVGLHGQASRLARTFGHPTLVFNLHEQFDRLRERGKFEQMKTMIRARDMAYQGSINPVLASFGESSEARQYSGRAVPDDWKCPFHPNHKDK